MGGVVRNTLEDDIEAPVVVYKAVITGVNGYGG